MNAWQKIKTVATFEFLSAVKRPGYLIATFGMPLFMAAYGAVVAVPAYIADKGSRAAPSVYGVVDEPGVLRLTGDLNTGTQSPISEEMRQALEVAGQRRALERALPPANVVFRPYSSRDEAHAALAERRLKGYFVIPQDYMRDGKLDVYTPDSFNVAGSDARGSSRSPGQGRFVTAVRPRRCCASPCRWSSWCCS